MITNNKAEEQGGGYAGCPISISTIRVDQGVAIYKNVAEGKRVEVEAKGQDTFILKYDYDQTSHNGNPEYEISPVMLGGKAYDWKDDKNSLVALKNLKGTLEENGAYLALHTDEEADAAAEKLAKVIISGNYSATKGGAIGSNGTVIFGEDMKVTVQKVWEDGGASDLRPPSVVIELWRKYRGEDAEGSQVQDPITLSAENNWKHVFEKLEIADSTNNKLYLRCHQRLRL